MRGKSKYRKGKSKYRYRRKRKTRGAYAKAGTQNKVSIVKFAPHKPLGAFLPDRYVTKLRMRSIGWLASGVPNGIDNSYRAYTVGLNSMWDPFRNSGSGTSVATYYPFTSTGAGFVNGTFATGSSINDEALGVNELFSAYTSCCVYASKLRVNIKPTALNDIVHMVIQPSPSTAAIAPTFQRAMEDPYSKVKKNITLTDGGGTLSNYATVMKLNGRFSKKEDLLKEPSFFADNAHTVVNNMVWIVGFQSANGVPITGNISWEQDLDLYCMFFNGKLDVA